MICEMKVRENSFVCIFILCIYNSRMENPWFQCKIYMSCNNLIKKKSYKSCI